MGRVPIPRRGSLRGARLIDAFYNDWSRDIEIERDLDELVYAGYKNIFGPQHPKCACDRMEEFRRGEKMVGRLANQRVRRKAHVDIAEVRRLAEDKVRSRVSSVIISNGRYGLELGKSWADEVSENGRVVPFANPMGKLIGIQSETCKMIWGRWVSEDCIEDIERWADRPLRGVIPHPVGRQSIPQNRRNRSGIGRSMQNSRVNTRPPMGKEEWECLAASITSEEYKNAQSETVWSMQIHQRLSECAGRSGRQRRVGD